jgi:hypothetical protein
MHAEELIVDFEQEGPAISTAITCGATNMTTFHVPSPSSSTTSEEPAPTSNTTPDSTNTDSFHTAQSSPAMSNVDKLIGDFEYTSSDPAPSDYPEMYTPPGAQSPTSIVSTPPLGSQIWDWSLPPFIWSLSPHVNITPFDRHLAAPRGSSTSSPKPLFPQKSFPPMATGTVPISRFATGWGNSVWPGPPAPSLRNATDTVGPCRNCGDLYHTTQMCGLSFKCNGCEHARPSAPWCLGRQLAVRRDKSVQTVGHVVVTNLREGSCYDPPSSFEGPPTFLFTPNVTPNDFRPPGLALHPCPPNCPVTCMPHMTCPKA